MKKLIYLGFLLILLGIFGTSYTYFADHRSAPSLSAYCDIDFQSSFDNAGKLEGATLTLMDYRYSDVRPDTHVIIKVDGEDWDIKSVTKQSPPTYSLANTQSKDAFKNTNKFFLQLPADLLEKIKTAKDVRVLFSYDSGARIDLPLNESDLQYWKNQLHPSL